MTKKEKTLKRKAYFYSDCTIPAKMILASLEVAEKVEKIDPVKEIEKCSEYLKEALYQARLEFPSLSIDEWYLICITCYLNSFQELNFIEPIINKIKKSKTKTWIEFKRNNEEISKISEKILLLYKKMKGKRERE